MDVKSKFIEIQKFDITNLHGLIYHIFDFDIIAYRIFDLLSLKDYLYFLSSYFSSYIFNKDSTFLPNLL